MSRTPFFVGLVASYASSFFIIDQIVDRRLLSIPKSERDVYREAVYNQVSKLPP
jgi:hypothetical protein